jgi:aminoglycoside phosphotransferase (APT) family kinase protein
MAEDEPDQAAAEPVAALMERAGVPRARIARHEPLAGGSYNTLHRVDLTDGTRLVLKVPPSPRIPRLGYEAELLHGEALFCASAATVGVPAPRVLHAAADEAGPGAPFLVMTHLPGTPWYELADEIDGGERDRLRSVLGAMVAGLHTVKGPGFGYPAQCTGPLTGRWAPGFAAMTGAVLDDAAAYGSWLRAKYRRSGPRWPPPRPYWTRWRCPRWSTSTCGRAMCCSTAPRVSGRSAG